MAGGTDGAQSSIPPHRLISTSLRHVYIKQSMNVSHDSWVQYHTHWSLVSSISVFHTETCHWNSRNIVWQQDETCELAHILRPTAVGRHQKTGWIYSETGAPSSGDRAELKNWKMIYYEANIYEKNINMSIFKTKSGLTMLQIRKCLKILPCLICYIFSFYSISYISTSHLKVLLTTFYLDEYCFLNN